MSSVAFQNVHDTDPYHETDSGYPVNARVACSLQCGCIFLRSPTRHCLQPRTEAVLVCILFFCLRIYRLILNLVHVDLTDIYICHRGLIIYCIVVHHLGLWISMQRMIVPHEATSNGNSVCTSVLLVVRTLRQNG